MTRATKSFRAALSLAILLAGCSAQAQPGGDHVTVAHDIQRLYGIKVEAIVRTATHATDADGSPIVTADLAIVHAVDTVDASQVTGNVEVIIAASDPNHGVDLKAIRPGATINAFVNSAVIDRATKTVIAQATPYQATLVTSSAGSSSAR